MTYRITITQPNESDIVETGLTEHTNPAAVSKIIITEVLSKHPGIAWTKITLEMNS